MSHILQTAERLASLGIVLQWLCAPDCTWKSHGHDTDGAGKFPICRGWSKLPYRPFSELIQQYRDGYNLSVLTGWREENPTSLVCVDLDSQDAIEWAVSHLPPTRLRTRTRRGEHWYYRGVCQIRPRNFRYSLPSMDMEILGNGRQVVAPSSVHSTGHVYVEVEPWDAGSITSVPIFDEAWFDEFKRYVPMRASTYEPTGTDRDGDSDPRKFMASDFAEARDRCAAYLMSAACPVSISGSGGDHTVYEVAIKVVRGWPLASRIRVIGLGSDANVTVDPRDAAEEAARLLCDHWNPRCLDNDRETPFPWPEDRIWYKVGQAAEAARLPGPDYWLFDEPEHRRRYADRMPSMDWIDAKNEEPSTGSTVEGSGTMETTMIDVQSMAQPTNGVKRKTRPAFLLTPEVAPRDQIGEHAISEADHETTPQAQIEIDHDTERMKVAAISAMAYMSGIYARQHVLVDMVQADGVDRHGMPNRPWVRKTSKSYLKSRMNSEVMWYVSRRVKAEEEVTSESGEKTKIIRMDVVKHRERADGETVSAILAAGNWLAVPPLNGMVFTPMVKPDGSVLQTEGYDCATGLYYKREVDHGEISPCPDQDHAKRACKYLLNVIKDFPFEKPTLARSVWLSAVLTRFCRFSYSGLAPMFAVSARESGSGKGLLADCAAIISDGRPADTMPFLDDEAEAKREILALLSRDDCHHVVLDNLKVPLSSAAYEAMLTGQSTVGREIGSSEVKRIVMSDAVWWSAGNFLIIGTDMSRRTLKMEILDKSGKPTERDVEHVDLKAYCRANRGALVRAALTILSGFAAAGAPEMAEDCDGHHVGEFASFEAWSRVVRHAVIWCGLPDPCRALASGDDQAAPEKTINEHLVKMWMDAFGKEEIRISVAARKIQQSPKDYVAIYSWMVEYGLTSLAPNALGKFLSHHVKGVATIDGKKYLMKRRQVATGICWKIEDLGEAQ